MAFNMRQIFSPKGGMLSHGTLAARNVVAELVPGKCSVLPYSEGI